MKPKMSINIIEDDANSNPVLPLEIAQQMLITKQTNQIGYKIRNGVLGTVNAISKPVKIFINQLSISKTKR